MSGGRIVVSLGHVFYSPADGSVKDLKGSLFLVQQIKDLCIEWTINSETFGRHRDATSASDNSDDDAVGRLRKYNFNFPIKDLRSIAHSVEKEQDFSYLKFILYEGDGYTCQFLGKDSALSSLHNMAEFIHFERSAKNGHIYLYKGVNEGALANKLDDVTYHQEHGTNPLHGVAKVAQDPLSAVVNSLAVFSSTVKSVGGSAVSATYSQLHPRKKANGPKQSVSMNKLLKKDEHSDPDGFVNVVDGHLVQTLPNSEQEPFVTPYDALDSFEVITQLPPLRCIERLPPVSANEFLTYQDEEGRILRSAELIHRIFQGGLDPMLRKEVWPFILGFYPWESTRSERTELLKTAIGDYYRIRIQWKTLSPDQEKNFAAWREKRGLVDKDVTRQDKMHPFFIGANNEHSNIMSNILCSHIMYNFDLGYVQGMSDILAPLMLVMDGSEVESFWLFVKIMQRYHRNFELSQQHNQHQLDSVLKLLQLVDNEFYTYLEQNDALNLYFCFQWLLILFKREFRMDDDVLSVWEFLWTAPCANMELLLCLAIISLERSAIMENEFGFNEILKHFFSISMQMNVSEVLRRAEQIYWQLMDYSELPSKLRLIFFPETNSNEQPATAETEKQQTTTERSTMPTPSDQLPNILT